MDLFLNEKRKPWNMVDFKVINQLLLNRGLSLMKIAIYFVRVI